MAQITYREALRSALMEAMDRDRSIVLLGEDIGVYQGTFRVTADFLQQYGPARVIDTPISELGFIGAAVGMAMLGLRPVVEVMTWNFAFLAADQILNNAAKVRYFSGGQVDVPLIIRGPNGAGVQLSAQHSQSVEALYAHYPGLWVAAPATPADAHGLLKTALEGRDPVIFLENAALYGTKGEVPEGDGAIPFGRAEIIRPGRDVTIVAYSRMVQVAVSAAQQLEGEGIEAEVLNLRTLRPLDTDSLLESVRRTHHAVVVQEQWKPFGPVAELAATIYEGAFDSLDAPVERVTGADVPMPYARNLELLAVPHERDIAAAVKRTLGRE
ncbi:MAG TPA: alpha-ketoacid dehydrogenase subunit beta [bacterium]|jgi:pyruvate dehydrogenase E1 component beta subunit|nr:alpha-ketoacid dehydrogenase subunit beta [bacterium]